MRDEVRGSGMTMRGKPIRRAAAGGLVILCFVASVACGSGQEEDLAGAATHTAATPSPTATTVTDAVAQSVSPTVSATSTAAGVPESTAAATATPGSEATATSSATATPSATPTATAQATPTATIEPTPRPGEFALTVSDGAALEASLRVEVASTQAERAQGLMGRTELPEDAGMLFVFGRTVHSPFWMKNTYVPLDIAFLAADGTVNEILEGVPESEALLQPAGPYLYVLEVNRGWFARQGLGAGAMVSIPGEVQGSEGSR